MNRPEKKNLDKYYREAESWSEDRTRDIATSRKIAWVIAGVAAAIALLEALALVFLVPLKTVVPYTLLVDRQTGYVEAINPLDRKVVSPDSALTRSFLVQYVIGRESFDIDSLNTNYRKVALWSADSARSRYIAEMQASNPQSPLAALPRRAIVQTQVVSVSSLGENSSMVRFTTTRSDPGAQPQPPLHWAAVVTYRFSNAGMTAEDRMTNPLGFQVTRYRRDAETLPEAAPVSVVPVTVDGAAPVAGANGAPARPVQMAPGMRSKGAQ